MSRGPPPHKAFDLARPVAKARGLVSFCRRERGSICDFVIFYGGLATIVRMARTKRIHDTPAGMEAQCAEQIAGLRMVQPGPGLTRELWVCNNYGTLRFFRVESSYLLEVDRDGKVLMGMPGSAEKRNKRGTGVKAVRVRVPPVDPAEPVEPDTTGTPGTVGACEDSENDRGSGGPDLSCSAEPAEINGADEVQEEISASVKRGNPGEVQPAGNARATDAPKETSDSDPPGKTGTPESADRTGG